MPSPPTSNPICEITKQPQRAIKPHWKLLFCKWDLKSVSEETTSID